MALADTLGHPLVYQVFQNAGGWFGARLRSMKAYLKLRGDERILDIGCGPGFISRHLPKCVSYVGYDPSHEYIAFAQRHFSQYGRFVQGYFDDAAVAKVGGVDVVMLNGVLHHMTDAQAVEVASLARKALVPGGRLFTLDGCRIDGQNAFIRALINSDRGKFVRTEAAYRALLEPHFERVSIAIDGNLSWVPYTFITMVATRASADQVAS